MKKLLLVATSCVSLVVSAAVPSGYVTEGLTACWDAIDNQGTGTHDASATTWVDLVGGQAFQLTGTTWGGDVGKYLQFAGTKSSYGTLTGEDALALFDYTSDSTDRTIELVFKYDSATTDGVLIEAQTHSNVGIGRWHGGSRVIYGIASDKTESTEPGATFYTISAQYKSGKIQQGSTYQDNVAVPLTAAANYWANANATTITLGKVTTANNYLFAGKLYAIRVYNRQLDADDVTQNYNADQLRFNREVAATVVSGSVKVGETTYEAGETIQDSPDVPTLTVDSATDAVLALADHITSLTLTAGTAKLADKQSGEMTRLTDLTLGATAVLQLPADGLYVTGTITAESGATVKGPGVLIGMAAECPVALTDSATYLCATATTFTWPSSGVAYIPVGVTADITVSDLAKIAGLTKIVFLGATSKVTYNLADAWTFNVPVEGPGMFAFESAGDISLGGDSQNLTGAFFFSNTTVLVTHEHGLGSTRAQTCVFWAGGDPDKTGNGHTIDFDNGENVFTNRVALWLYANKVGTKSHQLVFGAHAAGKKLVQDADFTFARYTTPQDSLTLYFKNEVWILGHLRFTAPKGYIYPRFDCLSGGVAYLMGTVNMGSTGILYPEGGTQHWGFRWAANPGESSISYPAIQPYSAANIICEASGVLGNCEVRTQQSGSTWDLNGFDQNCKALCLYGEKSAPSGEPLVKVKSAKPAALRIIGTKTYNVNPEFHGAAGFTMAGSGTYGLSNGTGESVIDTTGELKVESGTLNVYNNYVWSGTNVTVTGGSLVLDTQGAVAKDKTHLVVSGGKLALTANCGKSILVGYATFGTTNLLDGTYSKADLLAIPEVAPFVGDAWDDTATLTVQKPSEFEWEGWPDVPSDVKVPGNKTVYVGSDETNKVALALSINLGVNAQVVFTNMPDAAITMAMPISGKGQFVFEDCGTVTITADNSGLLAPGAFKFRRTNVVVAHRYGLGCADTGTCTHECALVQNAPGRSFTFTGDATANDVGITLDNALTFGYDTSGVAFVQNGDFTQTGGGTSYDYQRMEIFNEVTFKGVTAIRVTRNKNQSSVIRFADTAKLSASSGTFFTYGAPAMTLHFDTPTPSARMREFYPQNDVQVHLNVPFAFDLGDGVTAWNRGVYDMHGNDQQIACFNFAGGSGSYLGGKDPVVVWSATPATLYMTNNLVNHNTGVGLDSQRIFCVTGAVSLVYAGRQKQQMGAGYNDTTGTLTVDTQEYKGVKGTLEVGNGSYWGGSNVVIRSGRLIIDASCRTNKVTGAGTFFHRKTNLAIAATGATLELGAGRTDSVRSLKLGDAFVAAGVYGGPDSSAPNKLDCLAGTGLLRVRNSSDNPGLLLLVR